MQLKKLYKQPEIWLFSLPIFLTIFFTVLGYQILVSHTPEASIFQAGPGGDIVQYLNDSDVEPSNQPAMPDRLNGPIVAVPRNETQLVSILDLAERQDATLVYLTVTLDMDPNYRITLAGTTDNSPKNIHLWTKRTISQLHQNGYQTVLAFTLNAQAPVSDPAEFANSYDQFLKDWMLTTRNYQVAFVMPGITLGHPIYQNVSGEDMERIFATIRNRSGGQSDASFLAGYCCTARFDDLNLTGYQGLVLIPTPEFPFLELEPQAATISQENQFDWQFYYDRDRNLFLDQRP